VLIQVYPPRLVFVTQGTTVKLDQLYLSNMTVLLAPIAKKAHLRAQTALQGITTNTLT
jgi:hypothetical protein